MPGTRQLCTTGALGAKDRPCHQVCVTITFSQPLSIAEPEAYATQVSQLLLKTDIGVDLVRNQTAVHDRCSGSQGQTLPSRVRHDHTSQPLSVAVPEAYATQVSQLLLETDIGVNLASCALGAKDRPCHPNNDRSATPHGQGLATASSGQECPSLTQPHHKVPETSEIRLGRGLGDHLQHC